MPALKQPPSKHTRASQVRSTRLKPLATMARPQRGATVPAAPAALPAVHPTQLRPEPCSDWLMAWLTLYRDVLQDADSGVLSPGTAAFVHTVTRKMVKLAARTQGRPLDAMDRRKIIRACVVFDALAMMPGEGR